MYAGAVLEIGAAITVLATLGDVRSSVFARNPGYTDAQWDAEVAGQFEPLVLVAGITAVFWLGWPGRMAAAIAGRRSLRDVLRPERPLPHRGAGRRVGGVRPSRCRHRRHPLPCSACGRRPRLPEGALEDLGPADGCEPTGESTPRMTASRATRARSRPLRSGRWARLVCPRAGQALWRPGGVRGRLVRDRTRRGVWLPRPQRRRQDDDRAHPRNAHCPDIGLGDGRWTRIAPVRRPKIVPNSLGKTRTTAAN